MEIISAPKDGRPPEKVGTVGPMSFVESPQWANMQVQRRKLNPHKPRSSDRRGNQQSRLFGKSLRISTSNKIESLPSHNKASAKEDTEQPAPVVEMDVQNLREASAVDVTFKTDTDCTFFTWPMERLNDYFSKDPSIRAPLNSIVGADVATKLFTQAKSGEGGVLSDRRIYLPLDEPQEDAVVPTYDEKEQEEKVPEEEERNVERPFFQPKPPFDGRNSIMAEKRWLERRGQEDTKNDRELAAILQCRTNLNKYEISALLAKGKWRQIMRKGTVLIQEGEPTTCLCMILRVALSVFKGAGEKESRLHDILPEQMVGSLELLETEREHMAGETVKSLGPCTYISWDVDDLRELLAPRPRLRAQLTTLIAIDLAAKYRQVEEMV